MSSAGRPQFRAGDVVRVGTETHTLACNQDGDGACGRVWSTRWTSSILASSCELASKSTDAEQLEMLIVTAKLTDPRGRIARQQLKMLWDEDEEDRTKPPPGTHVSVSKGAGPAVEWKGWSVLGWTSGATEADAIASLWRMRDESVAALGHATVKRMTSVMAERQRLAAAVADMKRESHAPSELGSEVPASATAQIIAERDTEIDVVSSRMHDDIARLERSVSDIHQQLMDERRRSSVLDSEVERLAAALAGAKKYAKDVEFERDRLRTKIDVYRKEYCSVHEKCDALEEANLEFAAENKRLVSALDRAENALWEIAATRCSGTVAQEREVNYRDNLDEDESTVDRTERLIRGPYEFECAHASARMPVAVASCSAVDGDPPSRVMSTLASPVVKAESPDDVWGWALYDGASEGIAEKYRDEVYTADAVDTSAIYPLLLPGDDDDDEVGIMITEAELEARGPCPRLASAETRRDAGARVNALQLSLEAPDDDQTLSKSLTVTKSSYALGRALELLDQARAKAGQLRADLHEAQARESAVSRELARALVRLGDPT